MFQINYKFEAGTTYVAYDSQIVLRKINMGVDFNVDNPILVGILYAFIFVCMCSLIIMTIHMYCSFYI